MTGEGRWTWLNGWELEASLGHRLRPHFPWRRLDRMLPSACHEDQIVNLGLMATDFPQYRLSFDRPE